MSNGFFIGGSSVGSATGECKFTEEHEIKLENIDERANNYTHPSKHPTSIIEGLASVATTGNYSDLAGKPNVPTVPTSISSFNNDAGYIDGAYDNSTSGLTATTIQGAIDELKSLFDSLNSDG